MQRQKKACAPDGDATDGVDGSGSEALLSGVWSDGSLKYSNKQEKNPTEPELEPEPEPQQQQQQQHFFGWQPHLRVTDFYTIRRSTDQKQKARSG